MAASFSENPTKLQVCPKEGHRRNRIGVNHALYLDIQRAVYGDHPPIAPTKYANPVWECNWHFSFNILCALLFIVLLFVATQRRYGEG